MKYFTVLLLICSLFWSPLAWSQAHDHHDHATDVSMQADQAEVIYVCPMHPQIVRDAPGSCPICGMDLVARQPQSKLALPTVQVSEGLQQQLGIRTAPVSKHTFWRYYPTLARLQWNDDARLHVHPRVSGWIEQLAVRSEGQAVAEGDLLYTIYSKELVVAQQDLLQLVDGLNASNQNQRQRLLRDARLRLELLGVNAAQIKQLEQTKEILYRVAVYAPSAGVVTALNVAEGMYIEPRTELMTLSQQQSYWLIAEVPETQADWLRQGAPVDVSLPVLGLYGYETEVSYIYPELDPQNRTQRLRIELPAEVLSGNPAVGMLAEVELYGGPKREALAIPLESLIVTGHDNRVIVQQEDGRFVQRQVRIGLVIGDYAEVLDGLHEGEQVVRSGQFLLDAEASLRGGLGASAQGADDAHAHH